jgi:putative acetyltransferase
MEEVSVASARLQVVLIRRETGSDADAIDAVHRAAFPTEVEAGLVLALRADAGWVPALSLVAEDDRGSVVGHVVCTIGRVADTPALGLGPIGVLPEQQGRGVGGALMHTVLGAADALGYPVVVLLGHTGYYPRFGFVPATSLGIAPTEPVWGEHFQARTLSARTSAIAGTFRYAASFDEL